MIPFCAFGRDPSAAHPTPVHRCICFHPEMLKQGECEDFQVKDSNETVCWIISRLIVEREDVSSGDSLKLCYEREKDD